MKGPPRHTHSFGEGVQLVEVGVAHHMRPQPIAMLPAWFVDQHRHRTSFADHPLCTLYAPSTLGCMTAPEVELHRVWRQVFGRAAEPAFQSLTTRLREPTRRYHTATHVLWVVRHVDALAAAANDTATERVDVPALRVAALYHDAIYDPRSATNEHDSALLARSVLAELGWTPTRIELVETLIEATAGHIGTDEPHLAIMLDADLAILGADPAEYQAYVNGVRAEYAHVDAAGWRTGRAAVLRHFLGLTAIYRTPTMRAARERRAQANLTAELAALGEA